MGLATLSMTPSYLPATQVVRKTPILVRNDVRPWRRIATVRKDSKLWARVSPQRRRTSDSHKNKSGTTLNYVPSSNQPLLSSILIFLSLTALRHTRYVISRRISFVRKEYKLLLGLMQVNKLPAERLQVTKLPGRNDAAVNREVVKTINNGLISISLNCRPQRCRHESRVCRDYKLRFDQHVTKLPGWTGAAVDRLFVKTIK